VIAIDDRLGTSHDDDDHADRVQLESNQSFRALQIVMKNLNIDHIDPKLMHKLLEKTGEHVNFFI